MRHRKRWPDARKLAPLCAALDRTTASRFLYIYFQKQGVNMSAQATSLFDVGQVVEISFQPFTPRITFHSECELTVEIVSGDNVGFSDTVEYEAVAIRDDLILLSWQEHIGSTIVHMLDFHSGEANTVVTPAKGGVMRLNGRIENKSGLRPRE